MFERAVNAFWVLLGVAAASYAWTLGLIGPSGPESGLFPLLAALIIMGTGVVLSISSAQRASARDFPRGLAAWRVLGVVAGPAPLALALPHLRLPGAGAPPPPL